MLSVNAAVKKILKAIQVLPPTELPLLESLGHVLAADILAPEPLPFFTNSAMDGYAVSYQDLHPLPRTLKVLEDIPAGKLPKEKICSGGCARIMTGAPLPQAADAVVPLEQTDALAKGYVRILAAVGKGQYVRSRGAEIYLGEKIFSQGHRLKPADLGLLASLGISSVQVVSKPSVSLITSGSEIVEPTVLPRIGQIRNSNLVAVTAALTALGIPIRNTQHVKDNLRSLQSALLKCDSDVIITCGGVSVGEYDLVKKVISECGEIIFWKVAMKPGKPFLFGRLGRSLVFGLPGNPVSALVTFEVLVRPALLALSGRKDLYPATLKAVLTHSIKHHPDRQEYVRAHVRQTKRGSKIKSLAWQGSGMLRSLSHANAWIILRQREKDCSAGSTVNYLPFPP